MNFHELFRRAVWKVRFGRQAVTGLEKASFNAFRPASTEASEFHSITARHTSRLVEACARLNVVRASRIQSGYIARGVGAEVTDAHGKTFWLKVSGSAAVESERVEAEIASDALTSVAKPRLVKQVSWQQDGEHWVARMTEFAGKAIEDGPWSGAAAHEVTDIWIENLKGSLESLSNEPCDRIQVTHDLFERWLWSHFRKDLPAASQNWVASHNDLQWSNLCFPQLSILDWEWFGKSPRGYDQGKLIAYSCHDEELTSRLEHAFASSFDNSVASYAKLFAAHTVRNDILSGWLNPLMLAPMDKLVARWDAQLR